MESLTINGSFETNVRRHWLKLTNIVARFVRIKTLNLYINGIEGSNFKFLFENCSMLVELTMLYSCERRKEEENLDFFRTMKCNCKQIEIVPLVGKKSDFKCGSFGIIHSMFPKGVIQFI